MKNNFLIKMFLGADGDVSSKRLFLLLLIVVAVIYFMVNLFAGKIMKQSLEDYLFYSIWGFFFGVAAERWRPKKSMQNEQLRDEKPE